MIKLGLKIGSKDIQYTEEILRYYDEGIFQYIELFAIPETYSDTISYWKQFDIPFGIHAPHSAAGLNLANVSARNINKTKIQDAVKFADDLKASYIIFHSGVNGMPNEVVQQLLPLADNRFLIENKPIRGIDGSTCVGSIYSDLKMIIDGIGKGTGFCLDFGHAICAARTLKKNITDIACATSSSSASITGAVAAIAEPPQIDDPTPTRVAILPGTLRSLNNT